MIVGGFIDNDGKRTEIAEPLYGLRLRASFSPLSHQYSIGNLQWPDYRHESPRFPETRCNGIGISHRLILEVPCERERAIKNKLRQGRLLRFSFCWQASPVLSRVNS